MPVGDVLLDRAHHPELIFELERREVGRSDRQVDHWAAPAIDGRRRDHLLDPLEAALQVLGSHPVPMGEAVSGVRHVRTVDRPDEVST